MALRKYNCFVKQVDGKIHVMKVQAEDAKQAKKRVIRYGEVTDIVDKGKVANPIEEWIQIHIKSKTQKVDSVAFVEFLRQFAMLNNSGMSIKKSLEELMRYGDEEETMIPRLLNKHIMSAKTLNEAFGEEAAFFGKDYSQLILAGIESNSLPRTLNSLADEIDADVKLAKSIDSALSYPKTMLTMCGIVAFAIFKWLLPGLLTSMSDLIGDEPPALTQIMLKIIDWVEIYGIPVILGIVIVVYAITYIINKYFAYWRDYYLLKIPILGRIMRNRDIIRLYRSLGSLSNASVSTYKSLKIALGSVQNLEIKKQLELCMADMGQDLTSILSKCLYIDDTDLQMLAIGNETGNTGDMLISRADVITEDNAILIKKLTALIEPCITVIIGGMVGVVLMSVYMPMFSMMSATIQ